jgi:hypothetical protein
MHVFDLNYVEEEIFPIVTFDPLKKRWKCLGTGYFINPIGAFITAKHLLIDSDGKMEKTLYSVHKGNGKSYIRSVTTLSVHESADVIVGMLGLGRIGSEKFTPPLSKYCSLDLNPLHNGDVIDTYAFPNTQNEDLNDSETEFTFNGISSSGKIIDFHKDGSPVVRNRCYQTNMKIDSGASGGPVFKNNYIVGINSSGFTLFGDEEPISFITPIDYILDLKVKEKGKLITIRSLIENGYIKTK